MEVINLNLIPTGALPVVHASQYDEGRTFRANLMDGSTVYTLDGTETLECDVKKPDGNIVTVAVTNTSDSYVEIDTTLQMCACAGDSLAELHITKGAQEIGTLNFILAVERSPLEGGIESESEIDNLATQVAGLVATEVENQYDSANVIFDDEPTEGHGNGYTVTSEGIGNAIDAIDNALDMTDTASGSIATFESEYALPLRNLEIEINAVQSGSGTPSPDNVRPITGFTGANIHVADNENPHIVDNVTAISWQSEAGTVYCGYLQIINNLVLLTVTGLGKNISTFDWNIYSAPARGIWRAKLDTALPDVVIPPTPGTATTAICSNYSAMDYHAISGSTNYKFAVSDRGSNRFVIIDTSVNTVSDFVTANTNTMLVYPINTPVTYQLTPTQISAIVGTNNVFTDTNGDTSLEYYTKRGGQTVRIAEGVAVDVINNKNINNLTTTNKTLVGAVNSLVPTAYTNATRSSALSSGALAFVKIGKVVIANLNYTTNTSNVSTHDTVLYSNLPPAISNIYLNFVDEAGNVTRVRVGTDGKMHLHYSTITANKEINGSFVYLSA